MSVLGVAKSRIITGTVQARVLYQPEGIRCGTVDHLRANLLAHELQVSAYLPFIIALFGHFITVSYT